MGGPSCRSRDGAFFAAFTGDSLLGMFCVALDLL